MASLTRGRSAANPRFPLRLHATGQWTKRIRGRSYYFGKDRDAALKEYLRVKEDLEAGRRPPPRDDQRLTLRELCNVFLTEKSHRVRSGELKPSTFADYHAACERLLKSLGLHTPVDTIRPADLLGHRRKLAEGWGPESLAVEIGKVRAIFNFGFRSGLLDRPVPLGEFRRPAKSVLRRARAAKPARMFEAPELRQLLEAAQDQLRCMILLGANAGFGNWDVATLPIGTVDLQAGWIDFPRPKTGIARRCPLWPETAAALSETLAARKEPWDKQYAGVLFLTEKRRPWLTDPRNETRLVRRFRELLERLDLYRPGRGFYGLRHTFQTIGDETGDYLAVKRIMGHADGSISDAYRERFPDARLRAVAEHVRAWLFGEQEGGAA